MANSPQAIKRARQNDKRRLHNKSAMSALRTTIKKSKLSILNDQDKAAHAITTAAKALDQCAQKGLIHKNTAARKKRRLHNMAKKAAA